MEFFRKHICINKFFHINHKFHYILHLVILIIILVSCKKYPIGPQKKGTDKIDSAQVDKGLFIICEGNYNWGNGTVSFFNFTTKTVSNNVFYNANSRALGDIPQSMIIKDSIGFIIVNNSGKIEVINTSTFKSITAISGLNSPRYMIIINESKAYVSSLYGNNIYIINPETYQITGSINTGGSSEQMILYNNKVYAANWSNGNKIYVINALTDEILTTVTTVKEPNSMVLDKNNKLWILCSGGYMNDEQASLIKLNPDNFSVEKTFTFTPVNSYPAKLCSNATNDTLYFLNKGIFRMTIYDTILPITALVEEQNRIFYGLSFDKIASHIYVSNTVDYVQQGWVYRYSSNGAVIDSFKVDINPGEFCFN